MQAHKRSFPIDTHIMKKIIAIAFLGLVMLPAGISFAQVNNGPGLPAAGTTNLGSSYGGVFNFVCQIFNIAFYVLLLAAVGFVLLAAYRYLTAAGESDKVSAANKTLIFAAVAVAVALLARSVPVIVGNFVLQGGSGGGSFDVCGNTSTT